MNYNWNLSLSLLRRGFSASICRSSNACKSFNTFSAVCRPEVSPESSTPTRNSILPPAYHCNETWQRRLESPILQKMEIDDFFYQVDKKYQPDKVISPIDVDLFVNKVTEEENLEEVEELIYRLRKSPSAADALPSTGHAVIRALMEMDKTEMLFRILNDRMNYGIFLDFYTANLLMDKFLTNGNFRDAAKIAGLLMLEEDFGPSTTTFFAILSCLKYLENPNPDQPWDKIQEEESKDEVKYRVKYLRNPYFDDHFDLADPHHIIGKTLAYASLQLKEDEMLRNSIEVYGWALYDKWDKVERLLKGFEEHRKPIISEVLTKVKELVDVRLTQVESSPDKTFPKPKLRPVIGLNLEVGEVAEAFRRLNWDAQTLTPLPAVKNLLLKANSTNSASLSSIVSKHLSKAVSEAALKEAEEMSGVYRRWEELRVDELNKQIQRFKEIQLLLQHQEQKKELKERQDTIFFFDNEEEWMMKLEEKEAASAERTLAEQHLRISAEGKKIKKGKQDDSDYVSPIV